MSLLVAASLALAAQPAAAVHIPLAIPPRTVVMIEDSDVRQLAEGGTATFRQRAELSFVDGEGAIIAAYRVLDRRCDGPPVICSAFMHLTAGLDQRLFRYRISLADHSVTLLDAVTVPIASGDGEAATAVATYISQAEAAAPGGILAADVRQLIRFAATALPTPGETREVPEGQLRLSDLDATHAVITIQRAPQVAGSVALNGSGECRISRSTGLAEQCRYVDWTGEDRTRPVRERETRATVLTATVP